MTKLIGGVLLLSGMIIGAGMFAIPFAFVSAGFWTGVAELFILTVVMVALHLSYGEIVINTPEIHRLPGYVEKYLGRGAGFVSWVSAFFGISGVLLVYVLLGSTFLNDILKAMGRGVDDWVGVIIIAIFGSAITFFPLKKEVAINAVLTLFLIVFIVFLIILLFPLVDLKKLGGFNISKLLFPYGIVLFALYGGLAIPDLATFLDRERVKVRSAVIIGTTLPAILYFLFAFSVVGVSGELVSREAIRGLVGVLDERMLFLGSAVGLLAVFTSFTILGKSFQMMLNLDFGVARIPAWLIASLTPLFLYLLGFNNFVFMIAMVGAIAIGTDSALIIAIFHRLQRLRGDNLTFFSYLWKVALYLIIVVGILFELYILLDGSF